MGIIKGLIKWFGRRIGWILLQLWLTLKALAFYLFLLLAILFGAILALMGNFILLILSLLCSLFVLFIRGFGWITYSLMSGTKWFGDTLSNYTDSFFDGIKEAFQKEEDELTRRYYNLLKDQ